MYSKSSIQNLKAGGFWPYKSTKGPSIIASTVGHYNPLHSCFVKNKNLNWFICKLNIQPGEYGVDPFAGI